MHDSCNGYFEYFIFEFKWPILELISDMFFYSSWTAVSYVLIGNVINIQTDLLSMMNFCVIGILPLELWTNITYFRRVTANLKPTPSIKKINFSTLRE